MRGQLNCAIILKVNSSKLVATPNQLLVWFNKKKTGVNNSAFMRDQFVPYLVQQLQWKALAEAIFIIDSTSSHISPLVLMAAGLWPTVIPGGIAAFVQSTDAARYRVCHHRVLGTEQCGGGGEAQPQHTNHWAPRMRKRHQQEHRPRRPTERSDPTQHAKGRTGDCPGPRKGTTTRRNVTRGGGGGGFFFWPKAVPEQPSHGVLGGHFL